MNIPEQQIKEKCIGKIRSTLKTGTWNVFATNTETIVCRDSWRSWIMPLETFDKYVKENKIRWYSKK